MLSLFNTIARGKETRFSVHDWHTIFQQIRSNDYMNDQMYM